MTPVIALLSLVLAVRAVTIDVSPHVAFAPAFVRVTVHVQPNAENRGLYVEADGETYRSSFVQLEGADAPITVRVWEPETFLAHYHYRPMSLLVRNEE